MFFIKEENVRPGNRGGRANFKWEDIRLLNYKERECYIGATPKLGFLDKGGKWRKRDWWVTQDLFKRENKKKLQNERDAIKREEERLMNESLGITVKTKDDKLEKLTDFEWNAMLKKEHKFNPDDSALFEFYEDDSHKRGLGMKPQISFKTNAYDKDVLNNLSKLNGEVEEQYVNKIKNNVDKQDEDNPYVKAANKEENSYITLKIREYLENKEKNKKNRSRDNSKESSKKKDRKLKKDKKEKKHKKNRKESV